nr:hypothetical transcript [Hymenolepis microstoma]
MAEQYGLMFPITTRTILDCLLHYDSRPSVVVLWEHNFSMTNAEASRPINDQCQYDQSIVNFRTRLPDQPMTQYPAFYEGNDILEALDKLFKSIQW